MSTIVALYVDGGVIGSNPSAIGGTYAWRLIFDDGRCLGSGAVLPASRANGLGLVTNNQTEMMAILEGFKRLPDHFTGTIYSDSMVTLGRVFMGWRWKNLPGFMHQLYRSQRARLRYWNEIQYVLLDGHPTAKQLQVGIGKRGHPVSEHNVWCDQACHEAADAFMQTIGENIPTLEVAR